MINNPITWNKLLEAAPFGSVLMGGAIRDYILKEEAKDYDIFHTYKLGVPIIDGWVYKPRLNQDMQDEAYDIVAEGENNPIGSVYDYEVPVALFGTIKVQLIGVRHANPIDYFGKFDHTLTLGLYGAQGLYVDRRMIDGLISKTVTCTNTAKKIKSLSRAQNVVARIDPEKADDWKYLGF